MCYKKLNTVKYTFTETAICFQIPEINKSILIFKSSPYIKFQKNSSESSVLRLEDVLKTFWRCLENERLEEAIAESLEDVFARHLEEVLKMCWRRLLKTKTKSVSKMSSRCFYQRKCLLSSAHCYHQVAIMLLSIKFVVRRRRSICRWTRNEGFWYGISRFLEKYGWETVFSTLYGAGNYWKK